MTKKNFTSISVVLDRSASMSSCIEATIKGFNEFVAVQNDKNIEGECVVSLHQFDDRYQTDYLCVPVEDCPELNTNNYIPRGSTALRDAIGKTINELGQKLSDMPEDERPDTVIVAILTDGEENCSREFNMNQINDMISRQTTEYKWEFVFLAANQDAIATASSYGIGAGNSMSYASTNHGTKMAFASAAQGMLRKRACKATAYTRGASVADAADMSARVDTFTSDDRAEQRKEGAQ